MKLHVQNLSELPGAASEILSVFADTRVFLLYGSMGAGKTTFVKAICEQLGVTDSTSSPTFSIVNQYSYPQGNVYHFDFYRIKDEQEAFDMGYEEYFYSGDYCFIEWPEKIPNLLPEEAKAIYIEAIDEHTRSIEIK
ncbi:tRNA (adenosine(37)-N6)-threonylcarbamoyltransferase complex ATPase subunit type 1 TsaE [Sphingobacterium spiritivorum]|uniref:tRNA (adenosine(37)-N6)-threonylcarbamoyltransferase complex ATPase subunit type 1 TsaE n=1 Tax=Sphingobacterium spiritivorum TaxID=258 RepID=UPI00191B610E|nr:tRNA (adenosine(37)-N6)-threonylcarbamoyltransferase complex ATPase subunit type 1 TsaE [Sphingobacterium spiritivorum]QQT27934.1 tRNA (adenosine(37)-N6)-threonylcarbamoyltransferase complex ATPase subunit type 1 TsaE [Sphingobacterium spiritivorum]